jgi:hypothetical protein
MIDIWILQGLTVIIQFGDKLTMRTLAGFLE